MNQRLAVILAVAVGTALLVLGSWGSFTAWHSMMGLTLAAILALVPLGEPMSWQERAALSQLWGLLALFVFGRLLRELFVRVGTEWATPNRLFFLAWLLISGSVYLLSRRRAQP